MANEFIARNGLISLSTVTTSNSGINIGTSTTSIVSDGSSIFIKASGNTYLNTANSAYVSAIGVVYGTGILVTQSSTPPTVTISSSVTSQYGGGGNIDIVGGTTDYVSGSISWKNGTSVNGQVAYTGGSRTMTITSQQIINFATGFTPAVRVGINDVGQITSYIATGTAPFVVTSTTPVANLSIGGNAATVTTVTATQVTGALLTGYAVGTNTALAATDTVLGAFNKIQGQINASTTGTGLANYITKWSGTSTLTYSSAIYDDASQAGITSTLIRLSSSQIFIGLSGSSTTTIGDFDGGGTTAIIAVNGTLRVKQDVIAYYSSDKRLKDNVVPITNALDKISKIGGYEFDWNNNQNTYTGHDIGVIAQEIEEVLPELVIDRENGYKAVKYEKIVALLIEGMKDQQKLIENQQIQIDSLINK